MFNLLGVVYYVFVYMFFKGGFFFFVGVMVDKVGMREFDKFFYRGDFFLMILVFMFSFVIGGIWFFVGFLVKVVFFKGLFYGRELFYVVGLGILILFIKFNYYLMKGKGG